MVDAVPGFADVVIIGGGGMGVSAAYQLAKAGVERVVVLERDALGAASTARCAGGVRAVFSDAVNIQLGLHGLETFERFGEEFGQDIDLRENGYLFLLDTETDLAAFSAACELQNALGVESRILTAKEAHELSPLIAYDDLVGALWSPRAGHCTPESVVLGYASAARRLGAALLTGIEALGIRLEDGQVVGVETSTGFVRTSCVICTADAWSGQVGAWAGVELPVRPLRRQIIVTEPIAGLDPRTPFTIDFSSSFYFHDEGKGLLLGAPEATDAWEFTSTQDPTWLEHLAAAMQRRVPSLEDVGLARGWAGLYEMTPDHNALIGESNEVSRFIYATGFSGHGFLMAPAIGEIVRDLYLRQTPAFDISGFSASRFAADASRPELGIV